MKEETLLKFNKMTLLTLGINVKVCRLEFNLGPTLSDIRERKEIFFKDGETQN